MSGDGWVMMLYSWLWYWVSIFTLTEIVVVAEPMDDMCHPNKQKEEEVGKKTALFEGDLSADMMEVCKHCKEKQVMKGFHVCGACGQNQE